MIVVNGLSKSHSMTGLRLGWVLADPAVIRALAYMRFDNGATPLIQHMVYQYLQAGTHDAHVERLRAIYRERRDTALAAVLEHCSEYLSCEVPRGGFFLWLRLADGQVRPWRPSPSAPRKGRS